MRYKFLFAATAVVFLFSIVSCNSNVLRGSYDFPSNTHISKTVSSSHVRCFAEDEYGHIWMGTFRGVNRYDGNEFFQYFVSDSTGLQSNIITDIEADNDGILWFAGYKGVVKLNNQGSFDNVYIHGDDIQISDIVETPDGELLFAATNRLLKASSSKDTLFVVDYFNDYSTTTSSCVGIDGSIWFTHENAIYKLQNKSVKLQYKGNKPYKILSSCMMPNGELWISGDGNLEIYDTTIDQYKALPSPIANNSKLLSSNIYYLFLVDDTNVLICTLQNGVYYYNRKTQQLFHNTDSSFPFDVPNYKITTIFEDSHKNLWFGSEAQGYEVTNANIHKYETDKAILSFFERTSVISLAYDNSGLIVVSTLDKGLYTINVKAKEIKQLSVKELFASQNISNTYFSTIFVDSNNHLWLLSDQLEFAFECVINENGLWHLYTVPFHHPISVVEDSEGGRWIGGDSKNLLYIDKNNNTKEIEIYTHDAIVQSLIMVGKTSLAVISDTEPLLIVDVRTQSVNRLPFSSNSEYTDRDFSPFVAFSNDDGSFALGTKENGVYVYQIAEQSMRHIGSTSGLDVASLELGARNGWISTSNGIYRYNLESGILNRFAERNEDDSGQFYLRSSVSLPDGTLVFGRKDGITMFNDAEIATIEKRPVIFESLVIQDKVVGPGRNSPISQLLLLSPDVNILYNQNSFKISFSSLNYNENIVPSYSYILEGRDNEWTNIGPNHEIYLSSLNQGRYKLKVRLTSIDPEDTANIATLKIRVHPFPLFSGLAVSLYLLIAASLVFVYIFMKRRTRLLEMKLAKEQVFAEQQEKERVQFEKDQMDKLNRLQMIYFENVAHEFRTPLTMITGPIDILAQSTSLNKEDKKLLSVVRKSSQWLLTLVNQLLDSGKLSDGKIALKVAKKDIIKTLDYIFETYSYRAETKKINFKTTGLDESFKMWIDEDKIRKMLINLLSNAFKFTPVGGTISLGFDIILKDEAVEKFGINPEAADTKYAKFSVSDTGIGIPEDKIAKVFERFYQIDQIGTGSGIGLYYTKSLAEIHKGCIKLWSSTEEGKSGSTFAFIVPLSDSFYPEEIREITETDAPQFELHAVDFSEDVTLGENENAESEEKDAKRKLVIVDDDVDVANYLKLLLSGKYNVSVFYNASSALQAIEAEHPDIIISDVAMPQMNGYEFCKIIKDNIETCHIPVILVTAKVTINNQVEGLESGADAYVTKPFDSSYLKALIVSILENRERARRGLVEATTEEEIENSATVLSPQDKYFMKELYAILEAELANPELDVAAISEKMKMSRTKLYNKIKDLTGESPSVLFKTYKLNYAAKLLLEGKYNMSEVADMTGFSALSHFSSSFKKQFGVSPSDYKG